jgi:CDP-paratose 2-epimerase
MKVIVTGSSGLIGSEAVAFFAGAGERVVGVDNNMRRDYLGADGDTSCNLRRLCRDNPTYQHHVLDVRNRQALSDLIEREHPDAVIHCAAQPSHDLSAHRAVDDFDVNATGTLNLLDACRRHVPHAPFLFMSTNKVYGDAPNELPLRELPTRWDYARPEDACGVAESMRVDASLHSPFGASKLAADVLVQEYGRYYGVPTVCYRAGCVTGPRQAGAELHGFLSYLVRCAVAGRPYTIRGHGGKQVRDQIGSRDVVAAFAAFIARPGCGRVYNLGGGRANSVSVREAIAAVERRCGRAVDCRYDDAPRPGDHVCYISDLRRLRADYPEWSLTRSLDDLMDELVESQVARAGRP